jgi:fused signal recognition particle receptor
MFKWFERKSEAKPEPRPENPSAEEGKPAESAFSTLKAAVALTGRSILDKIGKAFGDEGITDESIDDLEETLIRADVGPDTAAAITDGLRAEKGRLQSSEHLTARLKREFLEILAPYAQGNQLIYRPGVLNVYLIVGVNGAGKTTLIGKLAHRFIQEGRRVVIGAGDTFRAAAEEQLETWAQRAGAEFVGAIGSKDPAAVIFEALKRAREQNADVALLDTAGRLQNKANLMEELKKIRRIIDQALPPDGVLESLLVLDATTGQNGLMQASVFKEAIGLSGVALTKLDSSSKGGIVLTIAREHRLPVKLVGVGEKIDDLKDFDAAAFVDALFRR